MDLTKIDKPLKDLDDETAGALFNAWLKGAEIQKRYSSASDDLWDVVCPEWTKMGVYRVKPEPPRPIKVCWEALNKDIKFIARDQNEEVYGFYCKPSPNGGYWTEKHYFKISEKLFNIDPGNMPWDESLIERPEGV